MAVDLAPTRTLRLYPLNPRYGTGAFRRRIRLRHRDNMVTGILDDNNHAMWVGLRHDGAAVIDIQGGFERWPTTGCPGAPSRLAELTGVPLAAPRDILFGSGKARSQCTHLYDLAVLALAMAQRGEGERIWDAIIPDAHKGKTVARLDLNGATLVEWPLDGDLIVLPGKAPQSLLSGFSPWATAHFSGDALEGATILRMAAFIARARAHITDDRPWPLAQFPERHGVCHAYSDPRLATAQHRVGVVRDFSQGVIETEPSVDNQAGG